MLDTLGDRMKGNYENVTRFMLPRRTFTIIRLDGKAFHTYTDNLKKPFDKGLIEDIDKAIIASIPQLQNIVFVYTQSDEISILMTDFETIATDVWLKGNIQKMVSVAASVLTAEFNRRRIMRWFNKQREAQWAMREQGFRGFSAAPAYSDKCLYECVPNDIESILMGCFDARAFTIPDRTEVMNYFIWRNQDCARNSLSMVAQANFSHTELQSKNQADMHEMLRTKGINWATDYTDGEKNGRLIVKESYLIEAPKTHPGISTREGEQFPLLRTRWVSKGAWKFTDNKEKLLGMIPRYE